MSAIKSSMKYIHVIIFFTITFGIGFLPPFAQITEFGMQVLGVFLGVVYGWLFLGLSWPSLIALTALGIIGYGKVDNLFSTGFTFMTLPQMILCYFFAEAIAQTNITGFISEKFLHTKIFAGKPFMLIAGSLFALFLMRWTQCGLAALFLIWTIYRDIAEKAGYEKKNVFCTAMVAGSMFVYTFTALSFPYGPGTLMQISYFNKGLPDISVSASGWIILFTIFIFLFIAIWTLSLKYIFRLDLSAIKDLTSLADNENDKNVTKMNKDQKFGLYMLLLFMFLMFAPMFLPKSWVFTAIWNQLGICGALAIVFMIMSLNTNMEGKPYLLIPKAARGVQWDVVWLIVATEPLATAFNSAEAGIIPSITTAVLPVLNSVGSITFLIASCILLGLVTQVVHNLVLIVVFLPLLCPLYLQLGGNPLIMLFLLFVSFNSAFATPAASWSSALMFGESSVITKKMYFWAFLAFVLSISIAILLGPLAGILL